MAQYWGQKVMLIKSQYSNRLFTVGNTYLKSENVQFGNLLLTPVSHISDSHLNDCITLLYKVNTDYEIGSEPPTIEDVRDTDNIHLLGALASSNDYLRSKGYAVPWRDLSVEDLVSYGWVKLKEG